MEANQLIELVNMKLRMHDHYRDAAQEHQTGLAQVATIIMPILNVSRCKRFRHNESTCPVCALYRVRDLLANHVAMGLLEMDEG